MIENSVNETLFQKTGCVEALPTVVFQIIQKYSQEIDYLRLMSSNLACENRKCALLISFYER
jgi:glycerol-3-phosphate responsive antiterminator